MTDPTKYTRQEAFTLILKLALDYNAAIVSQAAVLVQPNIKPRYVDKAIERIRSLQKEQVNKLQEIMENIEEEPQRS